jgi:hypothetical protein
MNDTTLMDGVVRRLWQLLALSLLAGLVQAQTTSLAKDPSSESSTTDVDMQAAEKFIAELKSIDWTKITQSELHERMKNSVTPFGWTLKDVRVTRVETDKGLGTFAAVAVEPAGVCIKQSTWLKLLGNPIGVTLGDPFGFVDVSTPEAVRNVLAGNLTIASFGYRLNGVDSFALEHQHPIFTNQAPTNGCFHYLNVVTN